MSKLVSVIIPTHNRKALTDMAIESVVTSFSSLIDIVVVDDFGSNVYSFEPFNSSGVRVQVIRLDRNMGPGMARQAGVAHASGRFIAFLDSDDRYDVGWMDYVVTLLQEKSKCSNHRLLITGITLGEKPLSKLLRRTLANLPKSMQLVGSRVVATSMNNVFYTQSNVMSRSLCFFKEGLRHSEDYYSTAFALFGADAIYLPNVVACHLGRSPNSVGGESAEREKMFRGEMQVRFAMLKEAGVPLGYKLCVPVGMAFQWVRTYVKILVFRLK